MFFMHSLAGLGGESLERVHDTGGQEVLPQRRNQSNCLDCARGIQGAFRSTGGREGQRGYHYHTSGNNCTLTRHRFSHRLQPSSPSNSKASNDRTTQLCTNREAGCCPTCAPTCRIHLPAPSPTICIAARTSASTVPAVVCARRRWYPSFW